MKYPDRTSMLRILLVCLCVAQLLVALATRAQSHEESDSLQSAPVPEESDSLQSAPVPEASDSLQSTRLIEKGDTLQGGRPVAAMQPIERNPFVFSPHDTISYRRFLQYHTYSLDHLLEAVPGFVVNRSGPIGADVFFSRYGIGAGRATVYMAGIPINDPQNDVAPFALFPNTTINQLIFNHSSREMMHGRAGLEGSVDVLELEPLPDRPFTAFELSKGTNELRQRRVRFASPRSRVGIDLGYDELLNDGYPYDPVTGAVDFGQSVSRFQTVNLRGELPSGETYFFSFRWFRDVFQGRLTDADDERRRSGHYAIASTHLDSWRFTFFERDYDVSLPDSHTVNHTTAFYSRVTPVSTPNLETELSAGFEDIHSEQYIGGVNARRKIRLGSLGGYATFTGWKDIQARFEWALGHHYRGKTGWGGRTTLYVPIFTSHEIAINAGRAFRLPNLGERFLPLHNSPALGVDKIVGNRYVDPEYAWETGIRIKSKVGFLQSELRFTGMRIEDAIAFLPVPANGETWLIAGNGDSEQLGFFEGRWEALRSVFGTKLGLSGGWVQAVGEREGFFANVPQTRLDAAFSISRDLFESTSGLLFIAEYQYSSERSWQLAGDCPAYNVLNLKLEGRLLDAHLYLLWLNVFDENYRTVGPPMLTPRTLVYGVQWTIFN
jgi:hypothetical protein